MSAADGVYTVCVMMDPGQRWRSGQAAARNQRQTSSPPTELQPVDLVQGWANLWLQSFLYNPCQLYKLKFTLLEGVSIILRPLLADCSASCFQQHIISMILEAGMSVHFHSFLMALRHNLSCASLYAPHSSSLTLKYCPLKKKILNMNEDKNLLFKFYRHW